MGYPQGSFWHQIVGFVEMWTPYQFKYQQHLKYGSMCGQVGTTCQNWPCRNCSRSLITLFWKKPSHCSLTWINQCQHLWHQYQHPSFNVPSSDLRMALNKIMSTWPSNNKVMGIVLTTATETATTTAVVISCYGVSVTSIVPNEVHLPDYYFS